MKAFILRWEWAIAIVAIVVAEGISGVRFGWKGIVGVSLGIVATWFNSWAWWRIAGLVGESARGGKPNNAGAAVVVMAFFMKLPIIFALGILARTIGGPTLPCFVAGLGMVYFGLVGWACTHA